MATIPGGEDNPGKHFPVDRWSSIRIDAQSILPLPLAESNTSIAVTVVNESTQTIDFGGSGALSLYYKFFDFDGKQISGQFRGKSIKGNIPGSSSYILDLEIQLPRDINERIASVRINLGKANGTRLRKLHRNHARIVLLDRGKFFSRFQETMLTGAHIWPQGQANGLPWPSRSMMVSERYKLLYLPVAKCACTSLKSAMLELAGVKQREKALELGVHLITDRFNTGVQLKDKSMKFAWQTLASRNYFKFMVVRQPFQRLVSAYLEKFVYNRHHESNLLHTRPVMEKAQGRTEIDLERGISFDDFVSTVTQCEELQLDPHWRPQYLYKKSVKHEIHTYKLDNIHKLEARLIELTGHPLKLAHRNSTQKSSELLGGISTVNAREIEHLGKFDPRSFDASEFRSRVENYYRQDIKLYNSAQ